MKNILLFCIFFPVINPSFSQPVTDLTGVDSNDQICNGWSDKSGFTNPSPTLSFPLKTGSVLADNGLSFYVDSLFIARPNGNFKESYLYDANGNMISNLVQQWDLWQWVNNYQYTYTWDENNQQLSSLYQVWNGEMWDNNTYLLFTRDETGKLLNMLVQAWNGNAWEATWLETYSYDSGGNNISLLMQSRGASAWVNVNLYVMTYDAAGNIVTSMWQKWISEEWENQWLNTYTYDAAGNTLTILNQDWVNNAWENDYLDTFTYDLNNNILIYFRQYWANGAWNDFQRQTCTYNAGGDPLTMLEEEFNGTFWNNILLTTRTFDENGNMLSRLNQNWQNYSWVNDTKTEYTFDAAKVLAFAYEWNGDTWMNDLSGGSLDIYMAGDYQFYTSGISIECYYSVVTKVDEKLTGEKSPVTCYPNPARENITIQFETSFPDGNTAIELFDQTGRMVKSTILSGANLPFNFDVKDLPVGLYIMKIDSGEKVITRKVVISG